MASGPTGQRDKMNTEGIQMRNGELQRSLNGVSQKVLSEKLRSLEDKGIVGRTVYPEVPPRAEYSLTDFGNTLSPVLNAFADWGTRYKTMVADGTAPVTQPHPA